MSDGSERREPTEEPTTFRANPVERWLGLPVLALVGVGAVSAVAGALGISEPRYCTRGGTCVVIPNTGLAWLYAAFFVASFAGMARYLWHTWRYKTLVDSTGLRVLAGSRVLTSIAWADVEEIVGSGGSRRSLGRFAVRTRDGRAVRLRGVHGSDDGFAVLGWRGMLEQHMRVEAAARRSIPFRRD